MEIWNFPRQSGKTTAMMGWLRSDPCNRVIVVTDWRRKLNLVSQMAREDVDNGVVDRLPASPGVNRTYRQEYWEKRVLTASEATKRREAKMAMEVGIDELDHVLFALLGINPAIASLTGSVVDRRSGTQE